MHYYAYEGAPGTRQKTPYELADELSAIIAEIKKRDEAVRFCIEYSKRPDTHDKDKLTVIHARLREALE